MTFIKKVNAIVKYSLIKQMAAKAFFFAIVIVTLSYCFFWFSEEVLIKNALRNITASSYKTDIYELTRSAHRSICDSERLYLCSVEFKDSSHQIIFSVPGHDTNEVHLFFVKQKNIKLDLYTENVSLVITQIPSLWHLFRLFLFSLATISPFLILNFYLLKRKQFEDSKIFNELTKQVSHDIRSPLAALSMVTTSLNTLPEDERVLIRNAISRINDIANDLLRKGGNDNLTSNIRHSPTDNNKTIELIPALVDVLVSEKRMQYREFSGLTIEIEMNESFGAFSLVDARELKRAISNLVNNAVEAFDHHNGKIQIRVQKLNKQVEISVVDNGKGIPAHLIEKLGKEQLSFGKEASDQSGSGLGLYHAKQTILHLGGSLEILSTEGKGTTISIKLNLADSPSWFTDRIDLTDKNLVISLDDDLSVHQIWASRLNILAKDKIVHKQFQSGEVFKKFVQENLDDLNKIQFLIDYELLSQGKTGLDIIEELNISKNSILVTSRYEEASIQARAGVIGLKLLPKSLAGFVPFEIKKAKIKYDIILLDDDQLVRMTWEMKAKQKGKSILSLASASELWAMLGELDKENVFYIDVHLSKSENGEQVTKKLFKLGYLNLYLATGYDSDQFPHVTWIKGVVGKNPVI
jgi:signal transduction histidine kinase